MGNLNREASNEFIKNSYYYDPKPKIEQPKLSVFNQGEKVSSPKHNLVEAESIAERLGTKYVQDNKDNRVQLSEALVKDTSKVKDVEAIDASKKNLKNLKKKEEIKVEKKEE